MPPGGSLSARLTFEGFFVAIACEYKKFNIFFNSK